VYLAHDQGQPASKLSWGCGGGKEAAKLSPFPSLSHSHAPGELACRVDLGVNHFVPYLKAPFQMFYPAGLSLLVPVKIKG